MYETAAVAGSQLQVRNETVGGVVGINREVDRAVQLLVWTDLSERFLLRKGPSRRDQQLGDCHRAPP
jgi:hypothetical protein